jgi:hypothetical protein
MHRTRRSIAGAALPVALALLTGCVAVSSPEFDGRCGSGCDERALGNDVYEIVIFEKPTGLIAGKTFSLALDLRRRALDKWEKRAVHLARERGYASCETMFVSATSNHGGAIFGEAEGRVKCHRAKPSARR